jgi:CheY-like chemotaxis protein
MDSKPKLLIVDDEAVNRRLLEKYLAEDYETRSVESGEACLELLESFTPDIFLLDVLMPNGMGGFELCEKIRSQHQFSNCLIIFLSA